MVKSDLDPNNPFIQQCQYFLSIFSYGRRKILKVMVINQVIFPKHTHYTLDNENQNMLELQIKMLHFLVFLILMQFYVM